MIILTAAVFSFYASARSLQIGDGVTVIAVTSVAANLSTILAGLAVFGDRIGDNALEIGVRLAAFVMILIGAALIPAPVRAGEALEEAAVEAERDDRGSVATSQFACDGGAEAFERGEEPVARCASSIAAAKPRCRPSAPAGLVPARDAGRSLRPCRAHGRDGRARPAAGTSRARALGDR